MAKRKSEMECIWQVDIPIFVHCLKSIGIATIISLTLRLVR